MAEFCLDCWNKLNNKSFTQKEYVLSKELELCEECGQWKSVIVRARRFRALYRYRMALYSKFHRK